MAILVLKSSRPIRATSMPSIMIRPAAASTILNSEISKVDLPLPVRPTMPIFSFCFMLIVMFLRTSTPNSWYLSTTFENFIFPRRARMLADDSLWLWVVLLVRPNCRSRTPFIKVVRFYLKKIVFYFKIKVEYFTCLTDASFSLTSLIIFTAHWRKTKSCSTFEITKPTTEAVYSFLIEYSTVIITVV